MKIIRVFARYLEDNEEHLILFCQVDDSNKIDEKMEALGYVRDWDDDQDKYVKYPFLLIFEDGICKLDYGDDEQNVETVNIHKKQIVVNEKFTRFYSNEEYMYKIEKVIELPFNPNQIKQT